MSNESQTSPAFEEYNIPDPAITWHQLPSPVPGMRLVGVPGLTAISTSH